MSAMVIVCSSCSRQLTVPPEVLGKKVKCPLCQEIFTAPQKAAGLPPPAPAAASSKEPEAQPPPIPRSTRSDDDRFPSIRRPTYDDDDYDRRERPRPRSYDRYDDDDDDFDHRRYRRRGRSDMEIAESAVAGPAICLMILGTFFVIGGIICLVAVFSVDKSMPREGRIWLLVGTIFGICWGGFIVLGGIMMKTMRSYAMAMIASILALINHPCFVLHLVLGIWSIVVLSGVEVRRAFRIKSER